MNERIKQLADEAGILKEQTVKAKIVKNEDGTWTSILEYPDLEKFAELIIQELIDSMIKRYGDDDELPIQEIKLFVKEHFGVKE